MKIYKNYLHNTYALKALLVAAFFGVLMSGCKSKTAENKSGIHIPKTASIAAVIDMKQISGKAKNWRNIFKREFLEKFDVDVEDQEVEKLRQLTEKVIVSIAEGGRMTIFNGQVSKDRDKNHFAIAFSIGDIGSFEEALKTNDKMTIIDNKENGKHVFLDKKTILTWKDNSALMVGYEFKVANIREALVEKAIELRKTTAGDALEANNKEFKKLLSEGHDIAVWANQQETSHFTPALESYSKMSPTIADLLKATEYGTSYIDFLDGKIVMNGKTFFNSKIGSKYQPILAVNNDKVLKNLPVKDPLLLMSLSINLADVRKIMEEENAYDKFDGDALAGLAVLGLTPKDIAEMLSGDLVIAVEDLELRSGQSPDAKVVIGLGLNRREVLEKILDDYVEGGMMKKTGNMYEFTTSMMGIEPKIILTKDAVFITATEDFKKAILSGKSSVLNSDLRGQTKKSNFLMFLKPDEILKKVPKENFTDDVLEALLPKIESIVTNMLPTKKDRLEGSLTVNFKDKSTNALEQLINLHKEIEERGVMN